MHFICWLVVQGSWTYSSFGYHLMTSWIWLETKRQCCRISWYEHRIEWVWFTRDEVGRLDWYVVILKGKATSAEAKTFAKDAVREVAHGDFSCSSAVGMMLYLSGHSWPAIIHAVNCTTCHMLCPRHFHYQAIKGLEGTWRLWFWGDSFSIHHLSEHWLVSCFWFCWSVLLFETHWPC